MKRLLSIILALCVCSSLCACNEKTQESTEILPTETLPTETEAVFWHDLFDPDANIAAVQQYVGKEATVIGRITEINIDCCKMDTFYSSKKTATIYMDTSILAKLQVGQFQAITGVVTAAEEDNYNITATEIGDEATQREIFETNITELFNFWFWSPNPDEYNPYIACEYVRLYWDECKITSDSQLKTALEGTWKAYDADDGRIKSLYVKFTDYGEIYCKYNGKVDIKYRIQNGELEYCYDDYYKFYRSCPVYMINEACLLVYSGESCTILKHGGI